MTIYEGPTTIPCPEQCPVPDGARLTEVPKPRHAWSDVIACPHDGCGRVFLVLANGRADEASGDRR